MPARPRRRAPLALAALLLCVQSSAAAAEPEVEYRLDLGLDLSAGTLAGRARVRVGNRSVRPVGAIPVVLYAQRFAEVDPEIDDVVFDRYYSPRFDPGAAALLGASDAAGRPLAVHPLPLEGLPEGVAVQVVLREPLQPGDVAELDLRFGVTFPERLGTFGLRGGRLTAEAGWLPYVPVADAEGARDPRAPPAPARYDLGLTVAPVGPGGEGVPPGVLIGGQLLDGAQRSGRARLVWEGDAPSLFAGPGLRLLERAGPLGEAPAVRVYGYADEPERAQRLRGLAQEAGAFVRRRLPGEPPADAHDDQRWDGVTFVEAPLRDRMAHARADVVLFSDRLFHVFAFLTLFHRLDAERAVVEHLLRQATRGVPLGGDREWVSEALAWVVFQEWAARADGITGERVRRGVDLLSFIPAFDRLARAPRFPGSDLYYGQFFEPSDSVCDSFGRALARRARGRLVAEKLRDLLGEAALQALVRETLGHPPRPGAPPPPVEARGRFRERAAAAARQELGGFFATWLARRPPVQNLQFGAVEVLGEAEGGGDLLRVGLVRSGEAPAAPEPVEVEGRGPDGEVTRARWDGRGPRGSVVLRHDGGLFDPLRLDPGQRVWQTSRADDETPRLPFKLLVNRFSLRVDFNQGRRNEGAAGVTVHPEHDYAHALTADAFYEQDEQGVSLFYAYRFGPSLDERRFGFSIGGGGTVAHLTRGVLSRDAAAEETAGDLLSFAGGFRFDTRRFGLNPTWGVQASVGVEWTDRLLGTDFRFTAVSGSLGWVQTLVRGTQLGLELVWGQIEGEDVPSQRLFEAGGEGAVRGVKTGTFVGLSTLLVRTELRHVLVEDLDVPVLWVLWLRKVQLAAFLDGGDVGDTTVATARAVGDWKWGAGGGLRLWLDAFGVVPVVFRLDLAVRIDDAAEDHDPQVYLGVGQSF